MQITHTAKHLKKQRSCSTAFRMTDEHKLRTLCRINIETWVGSFVQLTHTAQPRVLKVQKTKIPAWPKPAPFTKGLQVTSAFTAGGLHKSLCKHKVFPWWLSEPFCPSALLLWLGLQENSLLGHCCLCQGSAEASYTRKSLQSKNFDKIQVVYRILLSHSLFGSPSWIQG